MTNGIDPARRAFLRGGRRNTKPAEIRPPWGLPEPAFSSGCTRCHNCVDACPEQIIVPDTDGVPTLDFHRGECTFCRQCTTSCPEPLFLDPKRHAAWRHTAQIERTCLGYQGIFCQSCKESCEAGAIHFSLWERRIPAPRIELDVCTGCGACIGVCPVRAITMATNLSPPRQSDE